MVALFCFLIGLSVGWTGVGGFLLLIVFNDLAGLNAGQSLFLAFALFLLEGLVGAENWLRKKTITLREVAPMGIASLAGAIAGASWGSRLDPSAAKTILYVTVLVSGASIVLRDIFRGANDHSPRQGLGFLPSILLGLSTAFVCSVSGAGGPVLVIPLLITLGFAPKKSLALAITDSIFIAIPAVMLYGASFGSKGLLPFLCFTVLCHGAGLWVANRTVGKIRGDVIKYAIAVFSIVFSLLKLFNLL